MHRRRQFPDGGLLQLLHTTLLPAAAAGAASGSEADVLRTARWTTCLATSVSATVAALPFRLLP